MAIKVAACRFLGFCLEQSECPDGVCDDAVKALDNLGVSDDEITAVPKASVDLTSINWTALKEVCDAIVVLVAALKVFFGINRVGQES